MTIKRLCTATLLVGIASVTALAQSSDPLIGDWKLNVEKSKATGFQSGATKIEATGDSVKFTVDLAGTDGTKHHWSFTAKYDGKDYPVTGNTPYGNVVALTRVDARTIRVTTKQDGKVTVNQTIAVSADGKTRTTTTKGTNVKGQAVDSVSFYEKQ
ncbi:MAG TPA: hypothetical protein VES67_24775 [Vicinamibacterales bacterium]|nr:hypothetical protein [Vicinamibacterales bacterium]